MNGHSSTPLKQKIGHIVYMRPLLEVNSGSVFVQSRLTKKLAMGALFIFIFPPINKLFTLWLNFSC